MIIINFKTYKEATGKNALKLAKLVNKDTYLAVQPTDIYQISKSSKAKVLAQHTDNATYGRYTGSITPEAIKAAGAVGTLLNHSEKKIKNLKEIINKCKKLKLITIVCSKNLKETKKIIKLNPDYIAFEIPELIATGKGISTYKPKSVKKFVKLLKNTKIKPLCGSGISTKEDFKAALDLGTKGILLSSYFVKSKNPKKFLKELKNA
ncbi:MAG: triose-phosphate isomerase [Nanoarchaeota archaeon]|nr:triose-phosphate isomerase [Nanoarchaeota archaeon]